MPLAIAATITTMHLPSPTFTQACSFFKKKLLAIEEEQNEKAALTSPFYLQFQPFRVTPGAAGEQLRCLSPCACVGLSGNVWFKVSFPLFCSFTVPNERNKKPTTERQEDTHRHGRQVHVITPWLETEFRSPDSGPYLFH